MSVVAAIHQTSKPHEIAKRLNAQYRASEKTADEMGRDLVLLKQTKPPGIEWGVYLKELGIEFSREYADRLIRRVEPKKPIEPMPRPEPSPEPDIEIVDEFPDRKTLKPAERKTLYDEGRALLDRMDRQTRLRFFKYQEEKYLACFVEERERFEAQITSLNYDIAELRRRLDPGRCEFVPDDGGRAEAGYKPEGDCVIRAIAVATQGGYIEVRTALETRAANYAKRYSNERAVGIKRSKNGGYNHRHIYSGYLKSIGWQYTRLKGRTLLRAGSLPMGRLVVLVHGHALALIDGVIRDTYDSGRGGKVRVQGYWSKET